MLWVRGGSDRGKRRMGLGADEKGLVRVWVYEYIGQGN